MNDPTVIGPCADFEHELNDLLDAGSPGDGAQSPALRAHLEGCARCRAWQARWLAIDAQLAAALSRPAVSPHFDRQLQARIAALTARDRGAQRHAAEMEYLTSLDALRQGLGFRALGGGLATAALAGSIAWFAKDWLALGFEQLLTLPPSQLTMVCIGFAAVAAAVSVVQAARARA